MKPVLRFFLVLAGTLLIAWFIHIAVIEWKTLPISNSLLIKTYFINYLLASIIFFILIYFKEKLKGLLGFLFLGGSFLKFLVFFIFFMPEFKLDGNMTRLEATSFFIPYSICLILEVRELIRILNKDP